MAKKMLIIVFAALMTTSLVSLSTAEEPVKKVSAETRAVENIHKTWKSGKQKEAVKLARRALKTYPDSKDILALISDYLLRMADQSEEKGHNLAKEGNADEAARALARAVILRTDAAEYMDRYVSAGHGDSKTYRRFANLLMSIKDYDKALEAYKELLSFDDVDKEEKDDIHDKIDDIRKIITQEMTADSESDVITEQARDLVAEGRRMLERENYAQAAFRFSAALMLVADYAEARMLNAYALFAKGIVSWKKASLELEKLEREGLDDGDKSVIMRRYHSFRNNSKGDFLRAVEVLEPLTSDEVGDPDALILAGKCLIYLSKPGRARAFFETALESGRLSGEKEESLRKLIDKVAKEGLTKKDPSIIEE